MARTPHFLHDTSHARETAAADPLYRLASSAALALASTLGVLWTVFRALMMLIPIALFLVFLLVGVVVDDELPDRRND